MLASHMRRMMLQHHHRCLSSPQWRVALGGAAESPQGAQVARNVHNRHQRSTVARATAKKAGKAGNGNVFKYDLGGKEPQSIYEHPELYEAAFSFRDFKQEVEFLKQVHKKHAEGKPLRSVLDLGCGPAAHSLGLAAAGVQRVVGLDLNEDMLQYARWKVQSKPGSASAVELVNGDMAAFDFPGQKFDMIMCLLGTFSHMLENSQAVACFQRIAQHLEEGGVVVIELAHPGDLFDGTLIIGDGGKEIWEVPLSQSHKVLVEWGAEFDNFDPVTQILHRTVALNVMKGEDVESSLEEVVKQRQFTVQEVLLLASMAGLEVQELYGEMAIDVDLNHEEAYRMIAVLKKKA